MREDSTDPLRFQKIQETVWQTLLENEIRTLPVDLDEICRGENIRLYRYQEAPAVCAVLRADRSWQQSDGFSFCLDGQDYILYDGATPPARQRYTIAHELGHCLLDHFELCSRSTPCRADSMEQDAELFAIHLLAPACVLWGLQARSAQDIADCCHISAIAAAIHARWLARRYAPAHTEQTNKGPSLFASPLERQVYLQFQPYILANGRSAQRWLPSIESSIV